MLDAGLDDLRDWTNNVQPHIPIYVGLRDLAVGFSIWLVNLSVLRICLPATGGCLVWVNIVGFYLGQNNGAAHSKGGKCCFVKVMAKSHYYLVDTSVVMKGTAVTKLQFIPMSEETFEVHGLKVMLFS